MSKTKKFDTIKKYLLYMCRWQLSTPILALVIYCIKLPVLWQTVIANLIGSMIFFFVDKKIFSQKSKK